mmetsp:Transcript_47804/g.116341  ORF Transcript_47804/g.116341 Transcript_47804/m.116341 type:complete len:312 (-) Transcript_47804:30-965(-)
MPVYFKPGKFRSFQRQLNLYGFQRFTALKPFWESCYRHPAFSIQQRLGCTKIDRPIRQKKSSSDSQAPKDVNQPTASAAAAATKAPPTSSFAPSSSLSSSSAVAVAAPPTILPNSTPSSSVLTSNNETNQGWNVSKNNNNNNNGWLESQSMISREQMMADAAAARWRRLGETLQEQIQSTAVATTTSIGVRNDTVNNGWETSVPVPNKPIMNQQLIEPLAFNVDRQPELSSSPPDVPQSNHQNLLPSPPALQQQQQQTTSNDTVVNTTMPQVWDENDVNLCHEIMGQDCELCMDGNKLVEDFFRQRSQNNL